MPKHRRDNPERRARARGLVRFWYEHRTRENRRRYGMVAGEPVEVFVQPDDASSGKPWYRDRKVWALVKYREMRVQTSEGGTKVERVPVFHNALSSHVVQATETRSYKPAAVIPWGPSSRPNAPDRVEEQRQRSYRSYAEAALIHVMRCDINAHRALEMEAAGWEVKDIADELGCGLNLARAYIDIGLAYVVGYQVLVLPHWVFDEATIMKSLEYENSVGANEAVLIEGVEVPITACAD